MMRGLRGPLVSVIIPNGRGHEAALRTVIHCIPQTYYHREIVIGCSFSSPLIDSDPDIVRLVRMPMRGPSLGEIRNILVRESRGSVIAFLDDDDSMSNDRLARVVDALYGDKEAALCGSSLVRLEDPIKKEAWEWDGAKQTKEPALLYGATLAFRRSLWEKIPFDPMLTTGEDVAFMRDHQTSVWHDFRDPGMMTHGLGDNTCKKITVPPTYRRLEWKEPLQNTGLDA